MSSVDQLDGQVDAELAGTNFSTIVNTLSDNRGTAVLGDGMHDAPNAPNGGVELEPTCDKSGCDESHADDMHDAPNLSDNKGIAALGDDMCDVPNVPNGGVKLEPTCDKSACDESCGDDMHDAPNGPTCDKPGCDESDDDCRTARIVNENKRKMEANHASQDDPQNMGDVSPNSEDAPRDKDDVHGDVHGDDCEDGHSEFEEDDIHGDAHGDDWEDGHSEFEEEMNETDDESFICAENSESESDIVECMGNVAPLPIDLIEPPRLTKKGKNSALFTCVKRRRFLDDLVTAACNLWIRYRNRRKLLKQLAEECSAFAPLLRRQAAELRASAAQKRFELFKAGDMEAYNAMINGSKQCRLQEIMEETERIMADLNIPVLRGLGEVIQPRCMHGITLMPHQLQGLQWLSNIVDNRMSGILADDMGLGKTAQVLALFAHMAEKLGEPGPHLVLVPRSTIVHWATEINSWLPTFTCHVFLGNQDSRWLAEQAENYNIVLATVGVVRNNASSLARVGWSLIVVDEGHQLKNFKTKSNRAVRTLPCKYRLLLTGTPIQNSLRELWSLLSFVAPDAFGCLDDFERWFALPPPPKLCLIDGEEEKYRFASHEQKLLSEEQELLIIQRLHKVLQPFLLRRTKSTILPSLPEKRQETIWVPITRWQQELYEDAVCQNVSLMTLRMILNHPYHTIDGDLPEIGSEDDRLVCASGKFEFLDRTIPRMTSFGHKCLIFSQFTSTLDLIQLMLSSRGVTHARLDGSMSMQGRHRAVNKFQNELDCSVMLLSTRAGGVGLNLQAADTVILFDTDWNPQIDLQAMDRVHRIGQTKPVLVIRLATTTLLDRGILDRAERKLDMEKKVLASGMFSGVGEANGGISAAENTSLRSLIEVGRRSKCMEGKEPTPLEDINRLFARSVQERVAFDMADEKELGPSAGARSVLERLEHAGRLITPFEESNSKRRRRGGY